jgi:hypothetical protein
MLVSIISFYFIVLVIVTPTTFFLPNLIMTFSFFLVMLTFLYRYEGLFNIKSAVIIIFFIFGIFIRYIFVFVDENSFMSFSNIKLTNTLEYHYKTSLVILLSSLTFFLGTIVVNTKKLKKIAKERNKQFDYQKSNINMIYFNFIYIVITLFIVIYKFNNITKATEVRRNSIDGIVDLLVIAVNYFMWQYLKLYIKSSKKNKKSYLFLFLIPFILQAVISLLSLWKKGILFSIILLYFALKELGVKFNKIRAAIILIVIFLVVYSVISLGRLNETGNNSYYPLNISSIGAFLVDNPPIRYLSQRLQYYDEIYYVVNIDESIKKTYISYTGTILENVVTGIVPRFINKNKSLMTPGRANALILCGKPDNYYVSIAISYIGELLLSYGYLGVVLGNFIFSVVLNMIYLFQKKQMISLSTYLILCEDIFSFLDGSISLHILYFIKVLIVLSLINLVRNFTILKIITLKKAIKN